MYNACVLQVYSAYPQKGRRKQQNIILCLMDNWCTKCLLVFLTPSVRPTKWGWSDEPKTARFYTSTLPGVVSNSQTRLDLLHSTPYTSSPVQGPWCFCNAWHLLDYHCKTYPGNWICSLDGESPGDWLCCHQEYWVFGMESQLFNLAFRT